MFLNIITTVFGKVVCLTQSLSFIRAYSGPWLGASVCGCALVVAEPGQSLSLVTEGRWAREYSAQDNKNNDTAAAG